VILCRQGHQNDDGAMFCSVCHDYLGWESRQEDAPARPAVSAAIDPGRLSIVPGGQGVAQIEIRNRANVADEFRMGVIGLASDWSRVEPEVVSVLPEKTGFARLIVQPPKSPSTPAGPVEVEVRISSSVDSSVQMVVQGTVVVGEFADLSGSIMPEMSSSEGVAEHIITVENLGNQPAVVEVAARDQEGALQFELEPAELRMQAGQVGVTRLLVSSRRRDEGRRGRRRPFAVRLHASNGPEVYLQAATVLRAPSRMAAPAQWSRWLAAAAVTVVLMAAVGATVASAVAGHFPPWTVLTRAGGATASTGVSTPNPTARAGSPAAGGAPSASTTPARTPAPPTATPSTAPVCSSSQGGTAAAASITDVRVGANAGFDRLVIQFDRAIPVYRLEPNAGGTTFTGGAGGAPSKVAGSFGMQLQISGLTAPNSYPHGTDLAQSFRVLKEAKLLGDAQGTASFAIGLSGTVCPRLSTLGGPPRLVIDYPTA
jgi:hypothetical protein